MGALASVLVVLAALEYRWAGIASEANRERMQFTLHRAFQSIHAELDDTFVRLNAYGRKPRERLLAGLFTNFYVFAPIQSRPADGIENFDALLAELRK